MTNDLNSYRMRSTYVRRSILLLFWLGVLTPTAHPQPGKRKNIPWPGHLYQVSTRDKRSGKKRIGFIDKTGKLAIGFDRLPQTTIAVGEFHEGRAVIYLKKEKGNESTGYMNYTVGYIDQTGAVVIAPRLDLARDFSEGLAYVEVEKEGFNGFIDREGKTVVKLDGLRANDFHEGLAAVATNEREPSWGYINRSGRLVVKPQYSFADDFSEGLAGVELDRKYGFISKAGEIVIQPRFDVRKAAVHSYLTASSGRFLEGLACVRVAGWYGYIDKKGNFAIPPQFARAQEFSEGLAWVVARDMKKAGWINKSGRWVVTEVRGRVLLSRIPELVTYANELMNWKYSEGLVPFVVYSGDRTLWGYMDRKGNVAIEPRHLNRAGPFTGGVAWVEIRDFGVEQDYGYIDTHGRFIWRSNGVGRPQAPRLSAKSSAAGEL